MFNAFEELFAPGRKHTRDEENRLALTREDVGDNDPGRGPIDLASGKVVIRPPEPVEMDTESATAAEEKAESATAAEGKEAGSATAAEEKNAGSDSAAEEKNAESDTAAEE